MSKDYDPRRPFRFAEIYSARGDVTKPWYVYYFFRVPNEPVPKWHMFKKTAGINRIKNSRKRMIEARHLQNAINKLLSEGFNPFGVKREDNSLALKNCIDKWLREHVKNLRDRTYTTNKSGLLHLQWYFEKTGDKNVLISEIGKEKIIAALSYWQGKKKWSNRSRNNNLSRWRTFFNWLISQNLIDKNPCDKIKFEKVYPTDRNRPPTEREFSTIVNYLYRNDKPLFLFAMIIYYQGFRVTETGLLKRSQIEFSAENPFFRLAAKDQKDNEVIVHYVSPYLLKFFYEMKIDKLPPDYYLFSSNLLPGKPYLKKIKDNIVTPRWNETVKKKLKIPVDLYSMKHKQAGELGENNSISDKDLSGFFRHTDPKTTRMYMKNYRPVVKFSFFENQRPLPLKQLPLKK